MTVAGASNRASLHAVSMWLKLWPVNSSTRTDASALTFEIASRTSACIASLKLFNRSGRLSVSRAMPSVTLPVGASGWRRRVSL